jgi:FkbM family methyltransferase
MARIVRTADVHARISTGRRRRVPSPGVAAGPVEPDPTGVTVTVQVGTAQIRVVDTDGERYGDFWSLLADGMFEPATVDVIRDWAGSGRLLVDVGAWIGPFTLLAAAHGADVVAVEPDPVAAGVLRRNLAANPEMVGRVIVDETAWSGADGRARLTSSVGLGNARSALATGHGHGMPSRHTSAGAPASAVDVVTRNASAAFVRALADGRAGVGSAGDVLLKIDIEGGEFAVVPVLGEVLARHRPLLLLSIHQPASPGRLRSLPLRVRRLPAMARVLWALRSYPSLSRGHGHREPGWRRLGRIDRLLLVARLGEFELLAEP